MSPSTDDCTFARNIFTRFSKKPGASHIASEVSLGYLSACLRQFKPVTVLELGAGIGTITEALLTHPCGINRVVSTEQDPFCLQTLRDNLTEPQTPRLTVVRTPTELWRLNFKPDLIVGDGGFYSDEELSTAKPGTVFFCEGARSQLRERFSQLVRMKGWKIEYSNYGKCSCWALEWPTLCGVPVPFVRRLKNKGCWIGVVYQRKEF